MKESETIINNVRHRILSSPTIVKQGRISRVRGLLIECVGLSVSVGDICIIHPRKGKDILAEVVGIHAPSHTSQLMPYNEPRGISAQDVVETAHAPLSIGLSPDLVGRVVNGLGLPIDGDPPYFSDTSSIYPEEINPLERAPIQHRMISGIRAIDAFVPIGIGQRLGIFSGSGVGKSVLMGMMARNTSADINVIALIGERSREVRQFIDTELGAEGRSRSIIVASTSELPPLMRLRGAYTALTIAEYFRNRGNNVLLVFDSITRFAMAQREIGLSIGEPPTTRGYPPSVFSILPQILERCGPHRTGSITGLFSVLVDGDDMDEPISDAMRGLLDGHIVLSRSRAQRNCYPAIDVLYSVSRLEHTISNAQVVKAVAKVRRKIALYRESEELIQVGAYQHGSNPSLDLIIQEMPAIERFLQQDIFEKAGFDFTQQQLLELADSEAAA